MNHPLTDDICDALWDEHGEYYALYEEVRLTCRAAYDLGWKKAKKQDKAYIRQSYNQGYNDAKKEINGVLSHMRQLEEL